MEASEVIKTEASYGLIVVPQATDCLHTVLGAVHVFPSKLLCLFTF